MTEFDRIYCETEEEWKARFSNTEEIREALELVDLHDQIEADRFTYPDTEETK